MSNDLPIHVQDARKTYKGKVHALRGVTMDVHAGEIFGLLGPNGAGKSTLVKILTRIVRPTHIQGTLLGHPIGHVATLGRIGYLPEHNKFPDYLTGGQVLDFCGAMSNMDHRSRRKRGAELIDLVGLQGWEDRRVTTYSKGMKQRLGIAQSLINSPDLVFLDEPTDGVDPVGRREIRDLLLRLRSEGRTVFLNSHLLGEAEMVCDRIAILVQGKVERQGTVHDLTADSRRFEIDIQGPLPEWIDALDLVSATARGEFTALTIRTEDAAQVQVIIDRLRKDDRLIIRVQEVRDSLEELFLRAVTDKATGKPLPPGAAQGATE
jgi:ABC-2 type transport system ATP-binding protein